VTRAARLEPVQWAAIAGALGVLVWSIPGLFVNPDFAVGDDATSKVVLGVDMNGWHAVSGFPLAIPALWSATRPYRAAIFIPFAAAALLATAVWALLSEHPAAGLFYFPNGNADAVLHTAVALIFMAGAAHYALTHRRATA